jgi:hypothetical protein
LVAALRAIVPSDVRGWFQTAGLAV